MTLRHLHSFKIYDSIALFIALLRTQIGGAHMNFGEATMARRRWRGDDGEATMARRRWRGQLFCHPRGRVMLHRMNVTPLADKAARLCVGSCRHVLSAVSQCSGTMRLHTNLLRGIVTKKNYSESMDGCMFPWLLHRFMQCGRGLGHQ